MSQKPPEPVILQSDLRKDAKPDVTSLILTLHHNHELDQPKSASISFDSKCVTKDEMYERNITVDGIQKLDMGWIKDPAWVLIENRSEKNILIVQDVFEILPKQGFPFRIVKGSEIIVKPLDEPVGIRVHVTPR